MKKIYFIISICIFFVGCSKKDEDITIKNKNDSLKTILNTNESYKIENTELKTTNESLKAINKSLNKELDELRKNISNTKAGPSEEMIKRDMRDYLEKNTGHADKTLLEYNCKVIGNRSTGSDELYIAQCEGNCKTRFANRSFNFQAEINYKKFGGTWQYYNVDMKKSNEKIGK